MLRLARCRVGRVIVITVVASPLGTWGHSPPLGRLGSDVTVQQVVGIGRARATEDDTTAAAVVVMTGVVVLLSAWSQCAVDAAGRTLALVTGAGAGQVLLL